MRVDAPNGAAITKIDGPVSGVLRNGLTADEEQWALTVGYGSGADQGSLVLLGPTGERLVAYPCPRAPASMADQGLESLVPYPNEGTLTPFRWQSRRFVALTSLGDYAPSALLVLEATDRTTLRERAQVWNRGHLQRVQVHGSRIVAAGYDNARKWSGGRYGLALLVLDLGQLPDGDESAPLIVAAAPIGARGAASVVFASLPTDDLGGESVSELQCDDSGATVRLVGGLTWRVSYDGARIVGVVSESYRAEYPLRRERDPALPASIESHLQQLAAWARVEHW